MCSDQVGNIGAGPGPTWLAILVAQWLLTFSLVAVLGPDLVRVRGVEGRLYRRTIEIRDAQWELAGFVSTAMAEAVQDIDPGDQAEALLLKVALRAKLAGLPHGDTRYTAPGPAAP